MITVVVGKEIEKIKGDFESYLNGLNMVGAISYSLYSKLYDEGIKQIQKAYELGKSDLEKENAELKHNKETVAHLGNLCIEVAKQMLEEAIELLKEWIVCHGGTRKFHSALQDKTEQFLKEVDNDR